VKKFHRGEKGFTLVELLVVIAIIGVLAGVVVPNVGKFMNRGKTEAYATELHNVQTAVIAMMADSTAGALDADVPETADMSSVTAAPEVLTTYLTGLGADDPTTPTVETADPPVYVKTGCTYAFTTDGTVEQTTP